MTKLSSKRVQYVCTNVQKFAAKFLEKLEELEDWECLDKIIWVGIIIVSIRQRLTQVE